MLEKLDEFSSLYYISFLLLLLLLTRKVWTLDESNEIYSLFKIYSQWKTVVVLTSSVYFLLGISNVKKNVLFFFFSKENLFLLQTTQPTFFFLLNGLIDGLIKTVCFSLKCSVFIKMRWFVELDLIYMQKKKIIKWLNKTIK